MVINDKIICSICGNIHEDWPALAFSSPDNYASLSDRDKTEIGEVSSDFCVIRHKERTDRFIRVTFQQMVINHCEELDYGVWVSLSEKSFEDYKANFNNENHETQYFGWLSNGIHEYSFSDSIPMTIITKPGNARPQAFPHSDFNHPFVSDFYNGITKKEAKKRIETMLTKVRGQTNL